MMKLFFPIILLFTLSLNAETLKEQAQSKMSELELVITQLESRDIDTQKEKLALRTSEVFLKYADWDADNIADNTGYFASYGLYKDNAAQLAQDLPDFERGDVIKLLDETLAYAQQLLDGKVFRTPTPSIDWHQVSHTDDHLTYDGRPVFLADYTWKPGVPELTEFYGHKDGYFISPTHITAASGTINSSITNELKSKADGRPWFIFINNSKVPSWTSTKYGDDFTSYIGDPFYMYDVDHPGAREMMGYLLDGTVPLMAGKKYTELGYMLCNEPRWITYKNGTKKVWYTSPVSSYTIAKFKLWLKAKYNEDIASLNSNWSSSFASFDKLSIDVPLDISNQGKPIWYDWNTFNDHRAVEWFSWMKERLRQNDPMAKVHLKMMPSFFTDNDPATGIDLEALTELSDINGNDCAAHYNNTRQTPEWEEDYILGWRELYMGYDFLKSVKPNNLNFNTESHLLSTGHTRDLYMNPKYVRTVYWAATMLGMDVSQTWYWPRNADGSITRNLSSAYPGSNNQQPRVTNALHSTLMDLNAFSEEILAFQRQRKPLRIFYSKTSAHNKASYMDDLFELYESLNFEGIPLGFATQNIINKQDHKLWDAILIYKTAQITQSEKAALQSYLDHGGTIIMDNASLLADEYGKTIYPLSASNGKLLKISGTEYIKHHALETLEQNDALPQVILTENEGQGKKKCAWRCVQTSEGKQVLCVINYGRIDAEIKVELKHATIATHCHDLLKGIATPSVQTLAPYQILFVEVSDAPAAAMVQSPDICKAELYPSITNDQYSIALGQHYDTIDLKLYSASGQLLDHATHHHKEYITGHLGSYNNGVYLLSLTTSNYQQNFKLVKKS